MNNAAKRLRELAGDLHRASKSADDRMIEYTALAAEAQAEADKYRALSAEYHSAANQIDPPPADHSAPEPAAEAA